ncbi:MAG: branched-chain amino acid ABC transporter permease [Candidatus Aureabacteria bacterium]|nr:branched-chain amino acid ABC transporter permease [Candidatus Auribacterota bacterium]
MTAQKKEILKIIMRRLLLLFVIIIVPVICKSNYYRGILIIIGIYSMIIIGLNMLIGYAGQVSLGHAGLFGLAAYISGIMSSTTQGKFGLPMAVSIPSAIIFTTFISFLIGIPILKLKGHYLAMATLGLGVILSTLFIHVPITDGFDGFRKIPFLWIGGEDFATKTLHLSPKLNSYIIVWTCVFLTVLISENIINSRIGRALKSIHDSEPAALSLGISVGKYKNTIFTLSSFYAAVAGCLFAHYKRFIAPSDFNITYSITFVTMVVVGGARTIYGAILGAALLTSLTYVLQGFEEYLNKAFSIDFNIGDYHIVIYGMIIILVMIFFPKGIAGSFIHILKKIVRLFLKKQKIYA